MVSYKVTMFTGNQAFATTFNKIYIKLVGTAGESKHTHLTQWTPSFYKGAVSVKPNSISKLCSPLQ